MKKLIFVVPLFLAGCFGLGVKPQVQEICTPTAPVVIKQYEVLPDYMVSACPTEDKLPHGTSTEDLGHRYEGVRTKLLNCVKQIDDIRTKNEELKAANKAPK